MLSNYLVTVIKTGNSYALRVPKQYITDGNLSLGQKTVIGLPTPQAKQNRKNIQQSFAKLQHINAYKNIADPVVWQRGQRQDRPQPGRS